MYAVMWSEHCSYKSSKRHLGRFPTEAPWVLVGPGEGAGVIDVGDGLAVAMRIESHNHPSAVEPYQGAATGVGGIIRDIFSMGARPDRAHGPAAVRSARRRPHPLPRSKASSPGISGYGNAVGVPTVGGEVVFDDCYRDNPLVNVLCLGVLPGRAARAGQGRGRRQPRGAARVVHRSRRHRRRQRARVGRLRGGRRGQAAVGAGRRPVRGEAAHRGVPRAARRRARGRRAGPRRRRHLVRGVGDGGQDRRGHGRRHRPHAQPRAGHERRRGDDVGEPGADARHRHAREPRRGARRCAGAGRSARRSIGRVTDTGRFRVFDGLFDAVGVPGANPPLRAATCRPRVVRRAAVADVPVDSLGDGPVYDRPLARARRPGTRSHAADPAAGLARALPRRHRPRPASCSRCSRTPTIADKSWVWRQYDHQLFLNTVVGPGGDAAVLRLKGTSRAARARHRRQGAASARSTRAPAAALVVLEAARNVACAGAVPKALVNCLNFGNPEHPEVMWQFSEVVDGMSEACRALGIPVIGGNVSFYNESRGRDIDPTPVVGVVGLIDAARRSGRRGPRCATATRSCCSAHRSRARRLRVGRPSHGLDGGIAAGGRPRRRRARCTTSCATLVVERDGAPACTTAPTAGSRSRWPRWRSPAGAGSTVALGTELVPALAWFSESASRVVRRRRSRRAPTPSSSGPGPPTSPRQRLGTAGGDRLESPTAPSTSPSPTPPRAWRDALPAALGHPTPAR